MCIVWPYICCTAFLATATLLVESESSVAVSTNSGCKGRRARYGRHCIASSFRDGLTVLCFTCVCERELAGSLGGCGSLYVRVGAAVSLRWRAWAADRFEARAEGTGCTRTRVVRACVHACMHAHMHAGMRTDMDACIHVCMDARTHACMYACKRVCARTLCCATRRRAALRCAVGGVWSGCHDFFVVAAVMRGRACVRKYWLLLWFCAALVVVSPCY